MQLEHIDTVNESTTYSLELSRALDNAENGKMADTMNVRLPSNFNPDDKVQWDKILFKLEPYVNKGNFDTVLLKRETYDEKVYLVV